MTCTFLTVISNIPNRIIEAQVFERTIPISEIRFFNNKAIFILSDSSRCYASYFSPEVITNYVGLIGWVLVIFGLGWSIKQKKRLPIAILLVYPLIAMVNISVLSSFQDIMNTMYYWSGSIFGVAVLILSSYRLVTKK